MSAQRAFRVVALAALAFTFAGCATGRSSNTDADLLLSVARECVGNLPTVKVTGIDSFGRMTYDVRSPSDARLFEECYGRRVREEAALRRLTVEVPPPQGRFSR